MTQQIILDKPRRGLMKTGAMVTIIAAATPINAYLLTAGRTCISRKIHIMNRAAVSANVQFGTGLGGLFVQALPGFFSVFGFDDQIEEERLADWEPAANITVQADQFPIDIIVTVEEFRGPTG